jgi:hypothetical protein
MIGMIPCTEHGESAWCYVQKDGSHIDSEACRCFMQPSSLCPVDAHRDEAAQKEKEQKEKPI